MLWFVTTGKLNQSISVVVQFVLWCNLDLYRFNLNWYSFLAGTGFMKPVQVSNGGMKVPNGIKLFYKC